MGRSWLRDSRFEIRGSVDSQHIGPVRKQDGTGLCYAFTAVNLVQEKHCRIRAAQGNACRFDLQQDDRLSVLDATALANYGSGGIVHGGYTNEVLAAIKRAGGLAPESCAPFDRMINRLWDPNSLAQPWSRAFMTTYRKVQDGSCSADERLSLAKSLKRALQLQTSVDEVSRALGYRNASIAMKEAMISRSCEQKRIPLPPIDWKQEYHSDPAKFAVRLRELLSPGRSAGIYLCASPTHFRECGPHALTVRGTREVCCGKRCRREYRLQDSSDAFKGREIDRDGWVSESTLLPRVERYIKEVQPGRILWVD